MDGYTHTHTHSHADATYGPGAGCSSSEAQHYHDMHINTLTSQFASDGESDYLGMAVVADNSLLEHGVWQYYRGDRSSRSFSPPSSMLIQAFGSTSHQVFLKLELSFCMEMITLD